MANNSYVVGSSDTRPWGTWKVIGVNQDSNQSAYVVKEISVNKQQRLSLQYHNHRSEHWIIVSGYGQVTKDDKILEVKQGDHVFIPCGCKHRIYNTSNETLIFIEAQQGEKLREDDIVRIEDDYNRIVKHKKDK